jgi:capsid protein
MPNLKTSLQIVRGRRYSLGYNSIEDTTRRRTPQRKTSAESHILTPLKRDKASATVRDDKRNMSILAWMIRRHMDNVSRFTPNFRVPGDTPGNEHPEIRALNATVRRLLRWHGRRRNFDAMGRHGRDEWLRMFEACKIIEGDCGGLKVKGGRLQGIEGDRICKPGDWGKTPPAKKVRDSVTAEGLTFDSDGGMRTGFCVCKRTEGTRMEYERIVPDADMEFDAYWPDRFDSNRGVSPLLTALSEGADVRESWEWHLLKIKASGLFGFAFTRSGDDEMNVAQGEPNSDYPQEADGAASEGAAYTSQVSEAVKSRGLINLDLDPGDDVKSIESGSPNPNVIPFTREIIRSVLLALDIPFTFYDSLTASFSARIADRNEYEESCEWKREKLIEFLDAIYGGWLFPMWDTANILGFGDALKAAGMTHEEAAAYLEWVPAGRPWLDKRNEMAGHILALSAGATSTPRICSQYGLDAYDLAQEQREYLEAAGAPLLYAQGGQVAVQAIMAAMGEQPAQDAKPQERSDDE